ncbi:MAG: hypothetical protein KGN38_06895 [Actinomycetales bacterium]|nr:hypothetical protein [Actinomycetales bacterium]
MRRILTLAAVTATVAATLGFAGATGAAEDSAVKRDVVFVLDSTGVSAQDWLVQKRAYVAILDDTSVFPLEGTTSVAFIQYAATAGGGQASRVTVPLTPLDSVSARGKVTQSILEATLLAPDKPGVDGLTAAAQELSARGTKGAAANVCATANRTWDPATLSKGVSATKNAGATRLSVLALANSGMTSALASQAFKDAVYGDGVVVSPRNMPQLGNLAKASCLLPQVRLEAIEVTQVIQDWENSVPLAEYKDTIVRVYLETVAAFGSATATGLLHGERNGVPLSNSPLSPINTAGAAVIDSDIENQVDRESSSASLNFDLPTGWLSGDVTLTFESPATMTCSGAAGDATDCDVDVTFEENSEPKVDYVSVPYEFMGALQEPTDAAMVEIMYRTEDIFPAQHIDFDFDWLSWTVDDTIPALDLVNAYLLLHSAYEGCLPLCSQYFYGVLSGYGGGLANDIPGAVASGFVDATSSTGAYGYARNRGPHEIAHMVGAHHIVNAAENGWASSSAKKGWCTEEGGTDAPDYPYWFYSATKARDYPSMGPTGTADTEIWGVAPRFWNVDASLAVSNPYEVFPLMSYCKALDTTSQYRWPSTQTYEVLTDAYLQTRMAPKARASKVTDMIVVRGIVDPDNTSDVRFLPVLPVSATAPQAQDGPWAIRLLDRRGKQLAIRAFEMSPSHGDAAEPEGGEPAGSLQFLVPFPASVASRIGTIQLLKDQKVVSSIRSSATAPQVSVSSPKVGASLARDDVTVTWSAQDRDSDQLAVTVLYRPNAQARWKPVAIDAPGTSVVIPRSALAGSRAGEFLVIASDGVRFAARRIGPVRVADNAPILSLQQAEGNVVAAQNFDLEAVAWDREDGVLDEQLTWTSSLDGRLGQGRRLDLVASDLSEGVHVITVRATDSAKHAVSATMSLTVSRVFEAIGPK